jgi:hypothetical protein
MVSMFVRIGAAESPGQFIALGCYPNHSTYLVVRHTLSAEAVLKCDICSK